MNLPVNYNLLNWRQRKYVRELYIQQQNNLCHYCKSSLSEEVNDDVLEIASHIRPELFPPNFFKYPVHLHHNHTTGMTIGAVHCFCNAILWQFHQE